MTNLSSLVGFQAENARLIALLKSHGIEWRLPPELPPTAAISIESASSCLSTNEKVALFRRLFRGRTDVCHKPRIKCSDCGVRQLNPLSDTVIYNHLSGEHIIGVYPLLADDTCYFLAVDFDEEDWKEDALAFVQSCFELGVPAALEISRSSNGAHVWIFFSTNVLARDARRLGTAVISHACSRTVEVNFIRQAVSQSGYDAKRRLW